MTLALSKLSLVAMVNTICITLSVLALCHSPIFFCFSLQIDLFTFWHVSQTTWVCVSSPSHDGLLVKTTIFVTTWTKTTNLTQFGLWFLMVFKNAMQVKTQLEWRFWHHCQPLQSPIPTIVQKSLIPPKPRVLIIRDSISMVQITLYIDDKFQEGLFLSQYFQKC